MHRTVSLGRCFMAVALATILLTSPTAGFAQLGGLLPSPPAATSSTVVGDASAARVSVLGILGTAMTTALADTGTLTTANNALDASMLAGGIPSALSAETLSASTISWADQVDSEASLGNDGEMDGHSRSPGCTSEPLAERLCRAVDRVDSSRVPGSRCRLP